MGGEVHMIARPTHWRATHDGRESVAGPGGLGCLQSLATNGAKTGKITSRRYTRDDLELLAFRYGITVEAVKAAIAQGLLETLDARHR